ncbi:MAG TPA: hypothetical protein VFO00_05650 [Vitreimonas sp.]|nr:hypothetical protein [Vitreimonas sp.]
MERYWFQPHRYGLGATPKTWEGWAVIGVYAVALVLGAYLMDAPLLAGSSGQRPSFIAYVIIITAALLIVSWRTTEGGWRWRWGDDD